MELPICYGLFFLLVDFFPSRVGLCGRGGANSGGGGGAAPMQALAPGRWRPWPLATPLGSGKLCEWNIT